MILGSGGSAFCDGGLGAIQALNIFDFYLENGYKVPDDQCLTVQEGLKLESVVLRDADALKILNEVEIVMPCDVNNPLLGPNGSAYVYGPQKGAKFEEMKLFDDYMEKTIRIFLKGKHQG